MKKLKTVIPAYAGIQLSKQLSFKWIPAFAGMTIVALFYPLPAYAACVNPAGGVNIGDCFGFGDITSLGQAISRLVLPGFSIASAIVVIYFLFGAFKYVKAGGNKEEVAGARAMITHAIVGFIILIFAFFILQFLLSSLFGITGFKIFQ